MLISLMGLLLCAVSSEDPQDLKSLMRASPEIRGFVRATERAMGFRGRCDHEGRAKQIRSTPRGTQYKISVDCVETAGTWYWFTYEVARPTMGIHKGKTVYELQSFEMRPPSDG